MLWVRDQARQNLKTETYLNYLTHSLFMFEDLEKDGVEHMTSAGVIIVTESGTIIPHQALIKAGFLRSKAKMYSKKINEKITIYHDYRLGERRSYAYEIGKAVDHTQFSEHTSIVEAEAIAKEDMQRRRKNEINP